MDLLSEKLFAHAVATRLALYALHRELVIKGVVAKPTDVDVERISEAVFDELSDVFVALGVTPENVDRFTSLTAVSFREALRLWQS